MGKPCGVPIVFLNVMDLAVALDIRAANIDAAKQALHGFGGRGAQVRYDVPRRPVRRPGQGGFRPLHDPERKGRRPQRPVHPVGHVDAFCVAPARFLRLPNAEGSGQAGGQFPGEGLFPGIDPHLYAPQDGKDIIYSGVKIIPDEARFFPRARLRQAHPEHPGAAIGHIQGQVARNAYCVISRPDRMHIHAIALGRSV